MKTPLDVRGLYFPTKSLIQAIFLRSHEGGTSSTFRLSALATLRRKHPLHRPAFTTLLILSRFQLFFDAPSVSSCGPARVPRLLRARVRQNVFCFYSTVASRARLCMHRTPVCMLMVTHSSLPSPSLSDSNSPLELRNHH